PRQAKTVTTWPSRVSSRLNSQTSPSTLSLPSRRTGVESVEISPIRICSPRIPCRRRRPLSSPHLLLRGLCRGVNSAALTLSWYDLPSRTERGALAGLPFRYWLLQAEQRWRKETDPWWDETRERLEAQARRMRAA